MRTSADELEPQRAVVGELAVGVVEMVRPATPSTRAAAAVSSTRSRAERVGVGVGIVRALVAAGRDQHVHVGAGVGPARERAAGRDLGVVGVRVDREHAAGNVGVEHDAEASQPRARRTP